MPKLQFKSVFAGIATVTLLMAVLALRQEYQKHLDWLNFKASNHCREVSRVEGSSVYGMTGNGTYGVIVSPAKSTYVCDNITITRDSE